MDLLANAAWHALTGPQAPIAQGGDLAVRFDPDVSVFAALPDRPSPEAWDALAALVGPGNPTALIRVDLDPPPDWTELFAGVGVQMAWPGGPLDGSPPDGFEAIRLTVDDVPEMVALVARTEPGPFADRTIELGTYLGVRDPVDGALVAMAGQRLRPPGHVEISAVCTDVAFRGRGLARWLVELLIEDISGRGDVAILHAAATNTGAVRLYRAMGFVTVRELRFAALRAPGRPVVTDQPVIG